LETTPDFLEHGAHNHAASDQTGCAAPSRAALGDVILEARRKVAKAAGTEVSQVRIVIDWGE
jgi:hypothetical protein